MAEGAIQDTVGSIPEWLTAFGSFGQVALLGFGAWIAFRGLSTLREQRLVGRRIDLAEDAVRGFARMKDVVFQVSSGVVLADEIHQICTTYLTGFPEAERRSLAGYAAPLYRMNKYHQEIADFLGQKYVMGAYFGEDAENLYTELQAVLRKVQLAAEMLVDHRHRGDEAQDIGDREFWEGLRKEIWMGSIEDHPLHKAIEDIVSRAVRLFGAYLHIGPALSS